MCKIRCSALVVVVVLGRHTKILNHDILTQPESDQIKFVRKNTGAESADNEYHTPGSGLLAGSCLLAGM